MARASLGAWAKAGGLLPSQQTAGRLRPAVGTGDGGSPPTHQAGQQNLRARLRRAM